MRAFGKIELTTIDKLGELQFTVVHHEGWFELAAGPIFVLLALYFAWELQHAWLFVFGGIGLLSMFASWLHGRKTELRITSNELVAKGNLRSMFIRTVRLPTSDVTSIGWSSGGEGGDSGLYLKRGWSSTRVLPGISQQQARGVIDLLSRRFPEIPIEDDDAGLTLLDLFPQRTNITTLGLSAAQPKDPRTEK
jgi:hypothetical protein